LYWLIHVLRWSSKSHTCLYKYIRIRAWVCPVPAYLHVPPQTSEVDLDFVGGFKSGSSGTVALPSSSMTAKPEMQRQDTLRLCWRSYNGEKCVVESPHETNNVSLIAEATLSSRQINFPRAIQLDRDLDTLKAYPALSAPTEEAS